jgi:hypothetical protein
MIDEYQLGVIPVLSMFSRSMIDNSRSIVDNSRSMIDNSRSIVDNSRSIIVNSRVMLQLVASFMKLIYDDNIFIVLITGLRMIVKLS